MESFMFHDILLTKKEFERLLVAYPERIPVIVNIDSKLNVTLDKRKYLTPKDLTLGQFTSVIRKRVNLAPEEALIVFSDKTLLCQSSTMSVLQSCYPEKITGFLCLTYMAEDVFG